MSNYCTITSLQTLMIGTEFDSSTSALFEKVSVHADNEINKYLSKRYDTSSFVTPSIPPIVVSWSENLTAGYMYRHMARGGKEALAHAKSFIDPVLENLKAVAEYKFDIVNTAGSTVVDMSQTAYRVLSNTDGYSPTFNEDNELKWRDDQDKLDDIADERDA